MNCLVLRIKDRAARLQILYLHEQKSAKALEHADEMCIWQNAPILLPHGLDELFDRQILFSKFLGQDHLRILSAEIAGCQAYLNDPDGGIDCDCLVAHGLHLHPPPGHA